jgi:hypothetical protein
MTLLTGISCALFNKFKLVTVFIKLWSGKIIPGQQNQCCGSESGI